VCRSCWSGKRFSTFINFNNNSDFSLSDGAWFTSDAVRAWRKKDTGLFKKTKKKDFSRWGRAGLMERHPRKRKPTPGASFNTDRNPLLIQLTTYTLSTGQFNAGPHTTLSQMRCSLSEKGIKSSRGTKLLVRRLVNVTVAHLQPFVDNSDHSLDQLRVRRLLDDLDKNDADQCLPRVRAHHRHPVLDQVQADDHEFAQNCEEKAFWKLKSG